MERDKAHSINTVTKALGVKKGSSAEKKAIADVEKQFKEFVETPSDFDWTPLMFAAAYNHEVGVIDVLLNAGANLNAVSQHGSTPLTAAAANNTVEVIKKLIDAGSDVNRETSYVNTSSTSAGGQNAPRLEQSTFPLIAAARLNTPEAVELLLNSGARVNIITKDGWTPLQAAAMSNPHEEVIDILVNAGEDINAAIEGSMGHYYTTLELAASYNTPEVIRALIRSGADVNPDRLRNPLSSTPLMAAIQAADKNSNSAEIINILLDAGADICVSSMGAGGFAVTPLMMARENNASANVIDRIEKAESAVKASDEDGGLGLTILERTRPQIDAGVGFIPIFGAIASSIQQHEVINDAVLRAAATSYPGSISHMLENYGSDINAVYDDSTTLLMIAARNSYGKNTIEDIVFCGGDLEKTNKNGLTPLMFAAKYNPSPDAIWTLIGMGANLNAVDNKGQRAVDIAKQNRNPVIAQALRTAEELELYSIFDAAIYGSPQAIKRMVQAGADVNALYSGEYTKQDEAQAAYLIGNLLGIASLFSSHYGTQTQLGAGQDLFGMIGDSLANEKQYEDWTPLMLAVALNEDKNAIQALIDMGANVNAKAKNNVTAMSIALQYDETNEIVAMLERAGAKRPTSTPK